MIHRARSCALLVTMGDGAMSKTVLLVEGKSIQTRAMNTTGILVG